MSDPTCTLLGITARGEHGEEDAKGRFSYVREYEALFSAASATNIKTLLTALKTTVPRGSAYPGDTSARARRYDAAYKDGDKQERLLIGKVYFDNPDPDQVNEQGADVEPWSRPAIWGFGSREITITTGHDVNGNAILTYAGGLFDPVPEIPIPVWVCECRKAFSSFTSITNWRNAVLTTNAAGVTIAGISVGIGKGLLRDVNYTEAYYGTTKYYDASIRFEISMLNWGWSRRLVQADWYVKKTVGGVVKRVRAVEKRCEVNDSGIYTPISPVVFDPTALPVYLNTDGTERDCVSGSPPADPLYKDVQVYLSATWPTMPT